MSTGSIPQEPLPSWQDLEEFGAGDGVPTECERCGKPGTPRQAVYAHRYDHLLYLRRRACG